MASSRASDDLAQLVARARVEGRTLATSRDSVIALLPPFLILGESSCAALELGVRRVSTFAFLLIGIIGALVLIGAIPRMMAVMPAAWLCAVGIAWWVVRRARAYHGRFVIDLEAGTWAFAARDGTAARGRLEELLIRQEGSDDDDAPTWFVACSAQESRRMRLGRADEAARLSVLHQLRSHHVRVAE